MIQMDASDVGKIMRELRRSMNAAEGGKLIKREVSAKLRKIAKPLLAEQKARVLALPSRGYGSSNKSYASAYRRSMRQAIAKDTRVNTRWTGKNPGISIVQRGRGMPRDFRMAGRMFNRAEGWNPTSLAGETVHQQMTPADWFDQPTKGMRPEIKHEMLRALDEVAGKMARAAHGR